MRDPLREWWVWIGPTGRMAVVTMVVVAVALWVVGGKQ